jgi:hypothetical protein
MALHENARVSCGIVEETMNDEGEATLLQQQLKQLRSDSDNEKVGSQESSRSRPMHVESGQELLRQRIEGFRSDQTGIQRLSTVREPQ